MQGTPFDCILYLQECDMNKTYEVKEVKRRRTLTQNAYYWVMLNKLARALHMSDTEVHKNMLREYGVCDVMSLALNVPPEDYFKYFDQMGIDYQNGEERRILKIYKSSSRMNSAEFTRLIEGMREECVLQGIDVATPEEIARMKWVEGIDNDSRY